MWPFMVAGLIVAYGINSGAKAMMACKVHFFVDHSLNIPTTAS